MKNSYLIQRLKNQYKQCRAEINDFDSVFEVGSKTFSKDSIKLICSFVIFDYMGSAEFEFGAIPSAFKEMANQIDKYVADSFPVEYKFEDYNYDKKNLCFYGGEKEIFYICEKSQEDEIKNRIKKWAITDIHREVKEDPYIQKSLALENNVVGWFEINNNFLFFQDKKMWDDMCTIFGLTNSQTV